MTDAGPWHLGQALFCGLSCFHACKPCTTPAAQTAFHFVSKHLRTPAIIYLKDCLDYKAAV